MSASNIENAVAAQLAKWRADSSGQMRARAFITSLPFRIAEAKAAFGNICTVMTFGEDDYDRASGRDGIHQSECQPDWLKGAAKLVYDYCVNEAKLDTQISGGNVVVPYVPGCTTAVVSFWDKTTFDIVVLW